MKRLFFALLIVGCGGSSFVSFPEGKPLGGGGTIFVEDGGDPIDSASEASVDSGARQGSTEGGVDAPAVDAAKGPPTTCAQANGQVGCCFQNSLYSCTAAGTLTKTDCSTLSPNTWPYFCGWGTYANGGDSYICINAGPDASAGQFAGPSQYDCK